MGLHSYLYFSILIFTSPLLSLLLHSYLYSSTLISTSPLLSLLLHSYLYFSTLIFTNLARKSTWIQDPRIPLFCDYALDDHTIDKKNPIGTIINQADCSQFFFVISLPIFAGLL